MQDDLSYSAPRRGRTLGRAAASVAVLGLVGAAAWQGGNASAQDERAQNTATPVVAARSSDVTSVAARTSYSPIVDKVSAGVVTVRTESRGAVRQTSLQLPPELRRFFGPGQDGPQRTPRQRGLGSGVIVRADGYILTNNHVIDGAEVIRVEMTDKRVHEAKLVGTDPTTDLAVLKIDATPLHPVALGDSDQVKVGDIVLAVGNPLDVGQTVTMGIVSAKGRTTQVSDGSLEDFLQTDAPINQGNSGGALVNLDGELVGINSQILTPTGGNIGLGFAIPVNMARNVMDQLIKNGAVRRAKLGVTVQTVTADLATSLNLPTVAGGLVSNVEPGSAAAAAGLQQGDVILKVAGRPISDSNDLRNVIASSQPGAVVDLQILRGGRDSTVKATLDALDPGDARRRSSRSLDDGAGASREGRFGLAVEPLTPDTARRLELPASTKGVVVSEVNPDGAAAAAGLQPGDVIQKVNGQAVGSTEDLRTIVASASDKPLLLLVARAGMNVFLTMRAPRG